MRIRQGIEAGRGWKTVGVAVVLAATVVLPGLAGEAKATGAAGEFLRQAYLSVVDAELARAEERPADAVAAYRQALEYYSRLQAEYPGWQGAMVSYRVAECQNEIAAIEKAGAGGAAAVPARVGDLAGNDVARLDKLIVDLREVKAALAASPELPAAAPDKQLGREVERLRDELQQAAKANQALQRKVAKLEAKLSRSGGAEAPAHAPSATLVAAVKAEAHRLMQSGKEADAMVLLREAAERMPAEPGLVVLLGVAACRVGQFQDAVFVLQPFDVRRPDNADALLTLGTAYMGLGRIGEARDVTEKALKVNPDSAEAHYNLAQILVTLKPPEVAESQQHYRRALELGLPADPDFENTLRTALIISRLKKRPESKFRGEASRAIPPGPGKAMPLPMSETP
jgi:tetratricopeptide (TPR) repeat protein